MVSVKNRRSRVGLAVLMWTCIPGSIRAQAPGNGFVIDPSRPCVYIEFERVAQRKPISDEEASTGLWLRLKNNTRIPIEVMTFDPGTGVNETGVMDEVVQFNDVGGFGPSGERIQSLTFEAAGSPKGYSLDVASSTVIGAGKSLLFSVPLHHVGPSWYLRVRFEFSLPPTSAGRQPYSFVDFNWTDVPTKDRAAWKAIGRRKP